MKRTLRRRFYASHRINDRRNLNGPVPQDLIGRHGGALASLELGCRKLDLAGAGLRPSAWRRC